MYTGGLQDNDYLIAFGAISYTTPTPFTEIPNELKLYINKPIQLIVLRGEVLLTLTITPSTWSGRGMLGCHLTPV